MNKLSKLFVGFASLAMMVSCSSDEPTGGETNENKPAGDVAYMAIRIQPASESRSRSTVDGGFEDSKLDLEHDVLGAKFYFFDANGNYVMDASVYETAPSFSADGSSNNIEFKTTGILVLDNLTQKGYPTYMLTVLNAKDFEPESTLKATSEKLYDYYYTTEADKQYFVMSTTSYFGTDDHHDNTYCYVTKLTTGDFQLTPEAAKNTAPVDVYVERLAAKVQISFGAINTTDGDLAGVKGHDLYKLTSSVAGTGNSEENPAATTDLYLYVEGWGLNATSNKSYISKQLKADWSTTPPFASWQEATRFRSYWGMGTSYGQQPQANGGDYDITYKTFKQLKGITAVEYCNENTNDNVEGHIYTKNSAGTLLVNNAYVTHAVVHAVICDKDANPVDLINYKGLYYKNTEFCKYICNTLANSAAGFNYWIKTGTTDDEHATVNDYRQIADTDLTYVKDGVETGKCKLVLDATKIAAGTDIYKKEKGADGKDKWVKIDGGYSELVGRVETTGLTRATDGHVVYYVPIEHLAADKAENMLKEGYYGVVRNHWYRLTITDFKKIGHGVFDPSTGSEEILKPDGPEDPLYYVGARINIVNWHIVNQSTAL